VRITAGDLVQADEVRSGGSYLSQSDLRLHFGLGRAARADRVEIRWPSGKTDVIANLAANAAYTIKEGEGIIAARPNRK
jgi:hypothetical protein